MTVKLSQFYNENTSFIYRYRTIDIISEIDSAAMFWTLKYKIQLES